jgi:hypothetical protein
MGEVVLCILLAYNMLHVKTAACLDPAGNILLAG